jgi:hypothetical protein
MAEIDQLEGLELVAEFARALGAPVAHEQVDCVKFHLKDKYGYLQFYSIIELPSDLIIREFDRIKPDIQWIGNRCQVFQVHNKTMFVAESDNIKTAVARLVVKLHKEKAK